LYLRWIGFEVDNLERAVAVADPEPLVLLIQGQALGPRRAAYRLAILHDDADEAFDPPDIFVGLGVDDVDPLVRAVGDVIPAGGRIDDADIEELELLARDIDRGQQLDAGREGIAGDDDGRECRGHRKSISTFLHATTCHDTASSP